MSYENTHCPCGGRKLTDTMLCHECEAAVAGSFDRKEMDNPAADFQSRRNAAIRVLAVAQKRKSANLPLVYSAT